MEMNTIGSTLEKAILLTEFLGIELCPSIDCRSFQLLQTGLINKVLKIVDQDKMLGMKNTPMSSNGKTTSSQQKRYTLQLHLVLQKCCWIVDVLGYKQLTKHCSCCSLSSQVQPLSKRITWQGCFLYLQVPDKDKNKRHDINTIKILDLNLYIDSDYAGLIAVEDKMDSISIKSCTGFVIIASLPGRACYNKKFVSSPPKQKQLCCCMLCIFLFHFVSS